jgi:hypothetical protein
MSAITSAATVSGTEPSDSVLNPIAANSTGGSPGVVTLSVGAPEWDDGVVGEHARSGSRVK